MKVIDRLLVFAIILLPAFAFCEPPSKAKQPVVVRSEDFKGFEKCEGNEKLESLIEGMFNNPSTKLDGVWVYQVQGEYCGLPVKEIAVGVCDETGETGCGWASYLALIISRPLEEVKEILIKTTGVDFTIEKRDEDTQRTLRPILKERSGNRKESVLVCDPGNL